jgi:hypothetical protein
LQEWENSRSKVSLNTTLPVLNNPLSAKEISDYYEAVAALKPILDDAFLYKLTLLLTLTFFSPALTDAYLRTLWRHLLAINGSDRKPMEVMVTVYSSLYSILRLSRILMKVAKI